MGKGPKAEVFREELPKDAGRNMERARENIRKVMGTGEAETYQEKRLEDIHRPQNGHKARHIHIRWGSLEVGSGSTASAASPSHAAWSTPSKQRPSAESVHSSTSLGVRSEQEAGCQSGPN